jgi:hypothetical protein
MARNPAAFSFILESCSFATSFAVRAKPVKKSMM